RVAGIEPCAARPDLFQAVRVGDARQPPARDDPDGPRSGGFGVCCGGAAIPGDFVPISIDDALALLRPAAGRVLRALWALQPIQRAGLLDAEALIPPALLSQQKAPRRSERGFCVVWGCRLSSRNNTDDA